MQSKHESVFEKARYIQNERLKPALVVRQDHEIISIAYVVVCFQPMLHELVELVHVHVDQELGDEVAQGEPSVRSGGVKTAHDFDKKCPGALIAYISPEDVEKYPLVYGREELPYVAFQYPAGAGMVLRCFVCKQAKPIERLVCTLAYPARVRIGDERIIEERVHDVVYGAVHEPVAY